MSTKVSSLQRAVVCLGIIMFIPAFGASGLKLLAQEAKQIQLPSPGRELGMPLMQALKERQSRRNFSSKELPLGVLSDLLWAANGVNRPESGGRTAPSAMNVQGIDIYAALADGLYLYEPGKNRLSLVLAQDIRALTGKQDFVKSAAVNLVFVADYSRMGRIPQESRDFYAATDSGFISQNVYLFCASQGLATVVRGWFDPVALAKAMNLKSQQKVILAQSVGYPAQ